jgi:ElaB/YqjD/DUF883 family membrane-anchored ribosome-binding protein
LLEKFGQIESNASEMLSINHSLEHPLERLATFAGEGLDSLKRKIGSRIRTNNGMYSDPNAALMDEMFSRAGQANRAVTSSPFRAFVTQGALDALYFQRSDLMRTWNDIERQMQTGFGIETYKPNPTPYRPSRPPSRPTGALDCSILADTDRSRRLSIENQAAWLQLVTRCQ